MISKKNKVSCDQCQKTRLYKENIFKRFFCEISSRLFTDFSALFLKASLDPLCFHRETFNQSDSAITLCNLLLLFALLVINFTHLLKKKSVSMIPFKKYLTSPFYLLFVFSYFHFHFIYLPFVFSLPTFILFICISRDCIFTCSFSDWEENESLSLPILIRLNT